MNSTDRLLRAFIEASGYEIEETGGISDARRKELEDENMLFTLAVESEVDYKVTKKENISLLGALEVLIEISYSDRGYVEPEVLRAFKDAGGTL
jgi:hypothetical protein